MREKMLHKPARLTVAAYARHRKVSRRAVYDAIRAGRIARLPDGTIDPAAADRAWKANSSHIGGRRTGVANPAAKDRRPRGTPVSGEAVAAGEAEARTLLRKGGADVLRGVEQEISDRGAVKLLAEASKAGDEDERGSDE